MNLKAAIKNIKRSKFGVLITILLITIGLLGGYISINTISTLKGEYKYVENYFNGGNVFSINANFNYYKPIIDEKDVKIYEKIYNEIKNIKGVDILHYEKIALNLKKDSKREALSKLSNVMDVGDSLYLEGMGVAKEVIKHYDLEIESGKFFNGTERKDGVIDLVVGNNLKDAFQIGEEFEDTSNNKYRIIGVMKKDMEIPINIGRDLDLKDKKFKLDNTVICDFENFIGEGHSYYLNLSGSYIHMDKNLSDLEIDKIRNEIKQIFLKYDMVVNIKDDSKGIFLTLKGIAKSSEAFTMISIIILLFVSLSIIQFMMNSIQNRKREFGIYILNGGRIVDISKIVVYEIIIYMLVSLILLFIIVNALNIFTLKTSVIIIGLTIGYSFITFLLPYKKIKGFEVKELIKGDE